MKEHRLSKIYVPDSEFESVSLWVKVAAYAVPLCVLPSALWRIHAVFIKGFPPECGKTGEAWEPFYIAALSIVSFTAALLTIGLVSPWGEVFPKWIPFFGGRAVPIRAAVIPAGAGATFIFGIYAYALLNPIFHFKEPVVIAGCPGPLETPDAWVAIASYAPLLAWGPLLVVVTIAYYRRRTPAIRKNLIDRKIQQ